MHAGVRASIEETTKGVERRQTNCVNKWVRLIDAEKYLMEEYNKGIII